MSYYGGISGPERIQGGRRWGQGIVERFALAQNLHAYM